VNFQPHDPACPIQFQSPFSLKDRVSIQAGDGDENFFIDQRGGVGAVEIFQRPAAAAGFWQAESQIGELARSVTEMATSTEWLPSTSRSSSVGSSVGLKET
jgi:hypothetical protein